MRHEDHSTNEDHPAKDMADVVKAKVSAGEYASESEVVRDGLPALTAWDRAVDDLLHQQVGPGHDELKANPSQLVTAEQVRVYLAAMHAKLLSP